MATGLFLDSHSRLVSFQLTMCLPPNLESLVWLHTKNVVNIDELRQRRPPTLKSVLTDRGIFTFL